MLIAEDTFYCPPSQTTPEVSIDLKKGYIKIKGKSVPEDSYSFYIKLLEFLDRFDTYSVSDIVAEIELDYFNSNSSKFILDIFFKLANLDTQDKNVLIKWIVDKSDDDMREAGEDYKAIIDVPFEIVMK